MWVGFLVPALIFTIFVIWYDNQIKDYERILTKHERLKRRRVTGKRTQITRRY